MMCKQPYIKKPNGTLRTDPAGMLEATPLPCGRCLPCKINHRRTWQHRLILEASMHGDSIFSTLTYADDKLPADMCVHPKEMKNFLKRLRRRLNGFPFRYFLVGEYGDNSWRPHYHAMFFGLNKLQTKQIDSAWTQDGESKGFTFHGEVTLESAGYIAGYTTKKLTRKEDPQLFGRCPEFMRSSRKNGGIGTSAVKKIADTLMANKHWKPQIITELRHGKRTFPLGRYLTKKFAEFQGLQECDFEAKLKEYQAGLFNQHLNTDEWFYDSIINEKKEERKKQEWKFRNYKRRCRI